MHLNSQFDYQEFLKNSWQKTPKILRNFLSYEQLITSNELAGLACENYSESRLVLENPPKNVKHGPFLEELFEELPSEELDTFVQSVDLYDEQTRRIKSCLILFQDGGLTTLWFHLPLQVVGSDHISIIMMFS